MNKPPDSMKCNCKFSVYPSLFSATVVARFDGTQNFRKKPLNQTPLNLAVTVVCKAKKSQHIANY